MKDRAPATASLRVACGFLLCLALVGCGSASSPTASSTSAQPASEAVGGGGQAANAGDCLSTADFSAALGIQLNHVYARDSGSELACAYNNGEGYEDTSLPHASVTPGPESLYPPTEDESPVPGVRHSQYALERQGVANVLGGFCLSPRGGTLLIQAFSETPISRADVASVFGSVCK